MAVTGLKRFANDWLPKGRAKRAAWVVGLLISAVLLLLPATIRLDGKPHADWQQMLGRFHPLAVHLPIGLIVLVPPLEIVGTSRPALREAAGFVLGLAVAACLGTLILGYLLAHGSGDTGAIVTRHMWGGITLTITLMLCALARSSWPAGGPLRAYPLLLGVALLALLWTAHQGGSLTHGANYLTEYLPAPLKRWAAFGTVNAAAANPDSFYTKHIHPIFDANCVSCHGGGKVQGGLRLDAYGLLMAGGSDGAVVVPRNAATSMLVERITLPFGNKHFMPAEGHPPLKPEQIAWIRAWIDQGASPVAPSLAGISIAEEVKEPPLQPVGDYSSLANDIRQIDQSQGAKLLPVSSRPSDGLVLNTADVGPNFGDAQLAQLEKFAPYVVEAELARTTVTDASFAVLSKFTHLRKLHLEGTAITGNGLAKLASLSQLTYLNLSETKVNAGALGPLKSMKNLRHVYLFNTPAQPIPATEPVESTARNVQ